MSEITVSEQHKPLKSNMDRFIVKSEPFNVCVNIALKSNMDRFIEFIIIAVTVLNLNFKIQYG